MKRNRPEARAGQQAAAAIVNMSSVLTAKNLQEMLLERARSAALAFGVALLEQEVEALCGARYERKAETGLCHRGGSEQTSLVIDGARHSIRRPRVRDADGEVNLPSLAKLCDQDLLDEQMQDRLVRGVSTRNYEPVVTGYAGKLGISKSSVSRAFVRASQKDLDELNNANLGEHRFVALMVDGVEFASRTVVVALGITDTLEKVPLGAREGDTENALLVKDLLASVVERGFTIHAEKILAVIDGAKALKKALKDVFGDRVLLQRCWLHKLRNLQSYVPRQHQPQLYWRMKKLMNLVRHDEAVKELESMTHWLAGISQDGHASMLEVGQELLTVHKLGLPRSLRQGLSSTNAIESLIGVVRLDTYRVKNWKSKKTDQILRWVASSIKRHRQKMRRLKGYEQAVLLSSALGTKLEIQSAMA